MGGKGKGQAMGEGKGKGQASKGKGKVQEEEDEPQGRPWEQQPIDIEDPVVKWGPCWVFGGEGSLNKEQKDAIFTETACGASYRSRYRAYPAGSSLCGGQPRRSSRGSRWRWHCSMLPLRSLGQPFAWVAVHQEAWRPSP